MKDDLVYLKHISEAIAKIDRYLLDRTYDSFMFDDMAVDAVVRELEIIGEAAANITNSFKLLHQEIPWSKMIGMRNRLIHEYFGVNLKIVWETCKTDLVELASLISSLLS